jgi:two-component system, NarL family, response regulator LiaR
LARETHGPPLGILGGVLIAGLKLIEYRYLLVEHSFELYGGLVAAIFSAIGIWLGLKLTRTRETVIVKEVRIPVAVVPPPAPDPARAGKLGSSWRCTRTPSSTRP